MLFAFTKGGIRLYNYDFGAMFMVCKESGEMLEANKI